MQIATNDFETFLISPGVMAPRPVCLVTDVTGQDELLHCKFDRQAVIDRLIRSYSGWVNGAYIAFDSCVAIEHFREEPAVAETVWRAYDELRVIDVQIIAQLVDLAQGTLGWMRGPDGVKKATYHLADLAKRFLGIELDKNTWRLLYGTLYDLTCAQWEPGARKYPLDDLSSTRAVLQHLFTAPPEYLVDAARQTRASFWLALVSARGFALDAQWIEKLDADLEAEKKRIIEGDAPAQAKARADYEAAARAFELGTPDAQGAAEKARVAYDRARGLAAHGLVERTKQGKWKRCGTVAGARLEAVWGSRPPPERNEEAEAEEEELDEDDAAPRTPDGRIQLTKETTRDSGDGVLQDYSALSSILVTQAKVSSLRDAARAKMPIQARFTTILDTGRTACSGGKLKKKDIPNRAAYGFQVQNVSTEPGLRECFVPRPGYLLWSIDYGQLELCTWAQVCMYLFGFSKLGEMLNAKQDVHSMMGAMIFGLEYDWVTKNRKTDRKAKRARDCGKPFVFGKPGGMGDRGIQRFAAGPKYNVHLTLEECHEYGLVWKRMCPEHAPYFKYTSHCAERQGYITQLVSNRIRGGGSMPELSNTLFQGLAADTAKAALYEVERACYTGRDSRGNRYPALHGSYVVDFVHDEAIGESPIDRASEACQEAAGIMRSVAREWLPHVPPEAEPCLMDRWYKEASLVRGEDGRIKAWKPKEKAA